MKRAEAWWVNFGPAVGGEVRKERPAVIVRGKRHKAMADQLTTASNRRLQNRVGRLSMADMQSVEQAIKVQLGLT